MYHKMQFYDLSQGTVDLRHSFVKIMSQVPISSEKKNVFAIQNNRPYTSKQIIRLDADKRSLASNT